jgi:periplasmic divalent cation tolerance protein
MDTAATLESAITVTFPEDESMTEYMQVLTTIDSNEEAERLGRSITGARLAACVQIVGPIRSLYWWQGKLDDAQEWLLIIKTTSVRLSELEQHIKANHSYDTPEITATQIPWGSAEYLNWISAETRQTDVSS